MSLEPDAVLVAAPARGPAPRPVVGRLPPKPKTNQVKSGVRALEILELFERVGRPCRTSDVSRELGLPNSSVDRILKSLVDSGHLLVQWPSKLYRPSYRVVRTCSQIEHGFFGGRVARDLVQAARDQTGETAFLCVQNDCWVECILAVPAGAAGAGRVVEDMRFAIGASAPGVALLSLKTRLEIVEVARRADRLCRQQGTGGDYGGVLAAAAQARMQGFVASGSGLPGGGTIVATTVRHPRVGDPLCLAVLLDGGSQPPGRLEETGAMLRRIAHLSGSGAPS
jgi:DNA-binding IclR family transcriptional regulator